MTDSTDPQDTRRELGRITVTGAEVGAPDLASLRAWLRARVEPVATPESCDDVILVATTLAEHAYLHAQGTSALRVALTQPGCARIEVVMHYDSSPGHSLDDLGAVAHDIVKNLSDNHGAVHGGDQTTFWAEIPIGGD